MPTIPFALFGGVFVVVGLLMAVGGLRLGRSSMGGLPDDSRLLGAWRSAGVTPLPEAAPALRRAAARLRPVGVDEGAPMLGLPDGSGVRLAGRLELDGHEVLVGDVWDVTSILRVNERPHSATVKLRATAAVSLPLAGPPVVVAAEDHLSLFLDAVGLEDVQVESEVFNREWRVRAPDRVAAVAVLTPEVQLALQGRAADYAMEVRNGLLSVHQLGREADGAGLAACFEDLVAVTEGVLAGTRPHTWPEARPPDWTDAPITVDHRPPGMAHPDSGPSGCSAGFTVALGIFFAGIGTVFLGVGLVGMLLF